MTGSFDKIDYRLRPAKHAERHMLLEVARRLRFDHVDRYQYIGMGSVGFVDHRLLHKGLGISRMVSFEATDDANVQERFRRNVPLACIDMEFGYSTDVLPTLTYDLRSIVWLDYDDKLNRSMALDLRILAGQLKSGSLVFVTFAAGMPVDGKGAEKEIQRLAGDFPEFVGEQPKIRDFEGIAYGNFGRRVLGELFSQALLEVDAAKEVADQRTLRQVCYFRYRDGAAMCTVGWVVCANRELDVFQACEFELLPYFRDAENSFHIKIPKFTPFEIAALERLVPSEGAMPDIGWLSEDDRRDFCDIYRYLPNFGIFEPI